MKKMIFNKKNIMAIALTVAVVAAGIGGTYAILTSTTNNVVNAFEVGSVETEIVESGLETEGSKVVQISNVGKNDCYVRVRVTINPEGASELTGVNTTDWELKDDGYYYYKYPLKAQSDELKEAGKYFATEPLFTGYTVPTEAMDIQIGVSQEAVQCVVVVDGKEVRGMEAVWAAYDKAK